MKKSNKYLFLFMFVMLFTLILAACSDDSEDTSSNSNASDSKDNGEVSEATEKVKLTIGSWRTEDVAKYEKVIALFNETNPDIQVEFSPTKNTEYNTVLNTALQAGEGPDIFHLRPYAAGLKLAAAGFVEPITDLKGLDQFSDDYLAASRGEDGKQYGVPLNISSTQFFYNKKIFADQGLEVPTTWDEFMEVNEKLLAAGITPIAMGTKESWLLSLTHGIVGPGVVDGNAFADKLVTGERDFTDPAFVESIEVMNDLKKYFPANSEGLGMEDIRTLFAMEQAAMFPLGSWEIPVVNELNADLDYGFFPMPSKTGNQTVTTWVDGSFAINANSKNKEAAKTFLEFLTTKEFGELFVEEFKMISALPGITSNDELLSELSKAVETNSTPYYWVINFVSGDPTTKTVLETELQGMYLGEVTPAEVAQKVQENAEISFEPFKK
ncbi:sugar ABC transporter substrate-binding protein [Bacillus sp. FJAT-22090]|uniref:ABC transporter substrate-binding protein n=1 Tax=Bacillus sp. FJAT-22090 TaxID=1581038 RepID=UPI0006AE453B|nr:extracellular solute-binding protein [Bacillus sp. FJAT-22090]ALC88255.1 sugar ABC transporter substrate-binding protein [Bacillus sp. FJAT-22090]